MNRSKEPLPENSEKHDIPPNPNPNLVSTPRHVGVLSFCWPGWDSALEGMKPPAFQFYADDFISGASILSQRETGVYIILLCHQWNLGGLPDDLERLFLLARTNNEPDNEAAVRYVVSEKFRKCEDGKLRNERLERVRTESEEWREKSRIGGKASAAKRNGDSEWGKQMRAQRTTLRTTLRSNNEPPCEPSTNSPTPSPIIPPIPPNGANAPGKVFVPTELQLRLGKLFGRRNTTRWSTKELKALKQIGEMAEDEIHAIEKYYNARVPEKADYRRRDLTTLLNNWSGELDRARKFKPNTGF